MEDHEPATGKGPTPAERRWAWVRILLGQAQVIGAVVSLYLLVQTGLNDLSIGSVVVTCLLMTTSVLLFRGRKTEGQ